MSADGAPERPSDDKAARLRRRLTAFVREEATAQGFELCRITGPDVIPEAPARLAAYIAANYHGTMVWMEETRERRADPKVLWGEVRSIVMVGMNYGPDEDPRKIHEKKDRAAISVYARNRDYHDVMKGRLKEIAGRFAARAGADVKVFVDTAPVMEKPLAAAAGLGWQGKHTNLVSREYGSWLFLGSLFTTAELDFDAPEADHCGSCRACLDACPTSAFPAPYRIDARRCISYLTIEHKGLIDRDLRSAIGNRVYGCDDCLAACPWNKFAEAAREMKLKARDDLREPEIATLLSLDDAAFRSLFSGSPVKRIGRNRFVRNLLIAAGNSARPELAEPCRRLLDDDAPEVRGMAVWALSRLLDSEAFEALRIRLRSQEQDPDVQAEWNFGR